MTDAGGNVQQTYYSLAGEVIGTYDARQQHNAGRRHGYGLARHDRQWDSRQLDAGYVYDARQRHNARLDDEVTLEK